MNETERGNMMKSMMEQFIGDMSAKEKTEMCAAMMSKMTEGVDMKEMMPKMMMGMMSRTSQGGTEQKMPEMMLTKMMPHGIGVMLPAIDPGKRGDVAAVLLSALVEKGSAGMSGQQKRIFLETLEKVLSQGETRAASLPSAPAISHSDRLQSFERNSRGLSSAQPEVMRAFWKLHAATVADGALDTKTKELIALAISVVAGCDDCISHHINDAIDAGASKEELSEALGVAILMGGGTSVVYATHAIETLDQLAQRAA